MTSSERAARIKVPVFLGPTAAGKTDVALRLSLDLDLEILSCDSRQIYRFMDIGTAKPTIEQRDAVIHWMVDIVEPDMGFSCFQFAHDALKIIRERARAGKTVLVCGGSGLYYKTLSNGIGPTLGAKKEFRDLCQEKIRTVGAQGIFDELGRIDPCTAAGSHPSNVRRNIRALEVYYSTGRRFSDLQKQAQPPPDIEFFVVVGTLPRQVLYQRINDRVDIMAKHGLYEEFRSLRDRGYDEASPGMRCVGYKELFAVERHESGLTEALENVKKNTRNYAKRQITWFKHQVVSHEMNLEDQNYGSIKNQFETFLSL